MVFLPKLFTLKYLGSFFFFRAFAFFSFPLGFTTNRDEITDASTILFVACLVYYYYYYYVFIYF